MSKWEIVDNNMLVNSDFKNDAALLLSGDWNNEEEMTEFLKGVCDKLNRATPVITAEMAFEAIDAEEELVGDMPHEMFLVLRSADKQAMSEMLRILVRQTKQGIKDRLNEMIGGEK